MLQEDMMQHQSGELIKTHTSHLKHHQTVIRRFDSTDTFLRIMTQHHVQGETFTCRYRGRVCVCERGEASLTTEGKDRAWLKQKPSCDIMDLNEKIRKTVEPIACRVRAASHGLWLDQRLPHQAQHCLVSVEILYVGCLHCQHFCWVTEAVSMLTYKPPSNRHWPSPHRTAVQQKKRALKAARARRTRGCSLTTWNRKKHRALTHSYV